MADKVFTDEEQKMCSHLASLVDRQISMGVPPALAVGVVAGALGQVAEAQGVSKEDLPIVYQWVEQAYVGASLGKAVREEENATNAAAASR